jgi:hypothetical protein
MNMLHNSLYLKEIIRPGTRMTRIKRIYTDYQIRAHPPLRQLTSPTRMDLALRGDLCSIPSSDSGAINTELVRTETNSGYSKFVRVSFGSLLMDYHGNLTVQENNAKVIFQTGFTGSTGWFTLCGKGF